MIVQSFHWKAVPSLRGEQFIFVDSLLLIADHGSAQENERAAAKLLRESIPQPLPASQSMAR
jgi:hypothetical protein